MSLIDNFHSTSRHLERPKVSLEMDGDEGWINYPEPSSSEPDWMGILGDLLPDGIEAAGFEIVEDSVSVTIADQGWGRDNQGEDATSRRQYWWRVRFRRRQTASVDLSPWRESIARARPPSFDRSYSDDALVVAWADWQIGKPEGGGRRATQERFQESMSAIRERIRVIKPIRLVILGLGDLREGCSGHYPMQEFRTELNVTQQREVVTDMIMYGLKHVRTLVPQIDVYAVGGNHGEIRRNGKAYTDFSDNEDVFTFREAAARMAENEDAYGHIRFHLPRHSLTQSFDVAGAGVGIAHGHQFGSPAGNVEQRAMRWWHGQMEGNRPIGYADILVTGHFHHLRVRQQARTWIQAPALDGGSEWFTNTTGLSAPPGTLSFVVRDGRWDELRVS